ncbi:GMC family oxidoreductase [Marinilongibacter aquaticus]|uniref:GMC oxidoreductase n=1 Tax=Marinilongibacter aquaticus TaxID=2975157 RepID=UPI0021BD9246|nr:GMC family oxidoreductase [Marinilongibacter aquaticus]UBM57816.1 GMC family oxidoreductase [Marinilongibacter aquaticus]
MNLKQDHSQNQTFDAIVVGSGMSGGWAAKELCDAGLKTLVLERGRNVEHVTDYTTAFSNPWDLPHRGRETRQDRLENPIANKCYAYDEATKQFFLPDEEQAYIQDKPFDWIRSYQEGGKSLTWGRQTQRWSPYEFENPHKWGYGIEWPIRYDELAPWYSKVERFIGVSGHRDAHPSMPDGEFLKPFEMTCVEKHVQETIAKNYADRAAIIGRCAHLTEVKEIHEKQGRSQCQSRVLCYRGCPFGAYFSSNSSTIPWAQKTGNLTLRPHSIVHSIRYDEQKGKAKGVLVIDQKTGETHEFYAKIIFVNASTINSNALLLNSKSKRFPNGLGNDSGVLGKYLGFHMYRGTISALHPSFGDKFYYGRRPTAVIVPNFRNLEKQESSFLGGYSSFFSTGRSVGHEAPFGEALKKASGEIGPWSVYMMMQGETIPKESCQISLAPEKQDKYGLPQVSIHVHYDDNDMHMMQDFHEQGEQMLELAGFKQINKIDTHQAPGLDIHEMGGARMGKDPKNSILNRFNQVHTCQNVFVTDGACMSSFGHQNPSLTFMALTARAVDHAISELKKQNL